jgi:hypothetical protein
MTDSAMGAATASSATGVPPRKPLRIQAAPLPRNRLQFPKSKKPATKQPMGRALAAGADAGIAAEAAALPDRVRGPRLRVHQRNRPPSR